MTGWARSGKLLPKFTGAGFGMSNPGTTLAFTGGAEALGRMMPGQAPQAAGRMAQQQVQPMMGRVGQTAMPAGNRSLPYQAQVQQYGRAGY